MGIAIVREFLDMVDRAYGPEMTDLLSERSGVAPRDKNELPMQLVESLTDELSKRAGVPAGSIMTEFGKTLLPHVVGARPELAAGHDPLEILRQVVGALAGQSCVAITMTQTARGFELVCPVGRGADFLLGLAQGAAGYCRCSVDITRSRRGASDAITFSLGDRVVEMRPSDHLEGAPGPG